MGGQAFLLDTPQVRATGPPAEPGPPFWDDSPLLIPFTGGARTSYQPASPSRLSKEKNFSNLYGTKGRRRLSGRVAGPLCGAMQAAGGGWAMGSGTPHTR